MKKIIQFAAVALCSATVMHAQNTKDSIKSTNLEEVVLVGYGTQKKSTYAGSAATLDRRFVQAVKDQPSSSLLSSIQGAIPGATIISRPADVGVNPSSINIRGRGNFGGAGPQYVIDGVLSSQADFYRLNPRDIENLSVLKDASAAIYGNRAAFGVILVTTKLGRSGKMSINYDASYGLQSATYLPKTIGSVDYLKLRNEAARNAGTSEPFTQDDIEKAASGQYPDLYPNNNWYDLVYQSYAPVQEHNINVSGGGAGIRYYVSGGYLDQESLLPSKGMKRFNFRTNLDAKVSNKLNVKTNFSFLKENVKNTGAEISTISLARMVPTMVAVQSDGNWGTINAGRIDATLGGSNPLRINKEGGQSGSELYRFITSALVTYKPIDHVSIDGQVSYRNNFYSNYVFNSTIQPLINFLTKQPISGTTVNSPNNYREQWNKDYDFTTQLTATYAKVYADRHDVRLMLGTSYQDEQGRYIAATRRNYVLDNLLSLDAGSDTPETRFNSGGLTGNNRIRESFFGRLNYTLDNKYIFEGLLRADGSSAFDPGERWGYFPAVMVAWAVNREAFMSELPFSNLKLRASYGLTGNEFNVSNYDFLELLNKGAGPVLDQQPLDAIFPGSYVNTGFTWEVAENKNIGLDGALFNNKLTFSVDYYDRLTKDILKPMQLPDEYGAPMGQWPVINASKVRNSGVEAQVGFQDGNEDFNYFINANLYTNKNEIVDMGGEAARINGLYIEQLGGVIGDFYGYKTDGLLTQADIDSKYPRYSTNSKIGDIKYVDLNGDGVINGADRTVLGNDVPNFTYGFSAGVNYKGFDFAVNGQGVSNVKVYLTSEASQAFFNGAGAKTFILENRWTAENPNPNAKYPRVLLSNANGQNVNINSDFWLYDASYFRIRTMSLGYTLPSYVTDNLRMTKFRIFVNLQNYFTLRGDKIVKDFDPEFASGRSGYPNTKTVTFGLNASF